ncbi:MAG: molybdopterin-binding protein [Halovenus sp.]
MEVALITVGDELLAGDTLNTNGNWLAEQLTESGASVRRLIVLPDDRTTIAEHVAAYSDAFDAVIVTGGIGGTPDDVTMAAVADAFDCGLRVSETAREHVVATIEAIERPLPELDIDLDAEASIPAAGQPLLNEEGLAPGCVIENVYVLPGIPDELRTMFEEIRDAFEGENMSQILYTVEPEANITDDLVAVREQFDVRVGCYPDREEGHNRLKLTATDVDTLAAATEWLRGAIDASETPVSRDWD